MPKPRKLKVYRTTAGFHDAYVAAPSKKAALAAWGTTKDLFARGVAEIVEDPSLTAAPLASPGVVFKQSRGSEAEQIAALERVSRQAKRAPHKLERPGPRERSPPPSDEEVIEAQRAVQEAKRQHEAERKAIVERISQLEKERTELEKRQKREIAKLEDTLASRRRAHAKRMELWRSSDDDDPATPMPDNPA